MLNAAACIGSYGLPHFVELNILTLRETFGDIPILVSDDASSYSPAIEAVAKRRGADYICSESRRGHFAADMQTFISGLAYAQANNCDFAVKISQRFICLSPEIREQAEQMFSNEATEVLVPGKPTQATHRTFFGVFKHLTDVMFLRGTIDPEWLLSAYKHEIDHPVNKYSCYVEFFWDKMLSSRFQGRHETFGLITNHIKDGNPRRYLRRYQNTEQEYTEEARKRGIYSRFELGEWGQMEGSRYLCKPVRA